MGLDIIKELLRSSLTRYMKSFRTKSGNFLTFSTAIRNFGQNPANFGHFPPYIFLLGHFPSKKFGQNPAKNFGHLPAVNFGQNHVIPIYVPVAWPEKGVDGKLRKKKTAKETSPANSNLFRVYYDCTCTYFRTIFL